MSTMNVNTDSGEPYNDAYSIFNQFDRILYHSGRPLMQSELNENQSAQLDQQRMIANYSMNDGTIISGMNLRNEGRKNPVGNDSNANPNLFAWNGIQPNNADISNSDTYSADGEIDVSTDAANSSDYPSLSITYTKPSSQYATVSFDMKETGSNAGGRLENIGISGDTLNGAKIETATIDGRLIKSDELTNDAGYNLTDTTNQFVDLSGGNYHQVIITFDVSNVGTDTTSFDLFFNYGYDAIEEGCNVTLDHFKVESGQDVTPWVLNQADQNDASNSQRVLTYSVSAGMVYLGGYVRRFEPQEINIKGVGDEQIKVRLVRTVITSDNDKYLVDHSSGAKSYGSPGADREQYHVYLTYGDEDKNDPSNAVIYYLHDGHIVGTADTNRKQQLEQVLAQRTYETNGSYLVKGMDMSVHADKYDPSEINIQFAPGVAYVLGHRIENDGSDTIPIDVEKSTTVENNEVHQYNPRLGNANLIIPNQQPLMLHRVNDKGGIDVFAELKADFTFNLSGGSVDYISGENMHYDPNQIQWNANSKLMIGKTQVNSDSFTISDGKVYWNDNITDINGKPIPLREGTVCYIYSTTLQHLQTNDTSERTDNDLDSADQASDSSDFHIKQLANDKVAIDLSPVQNQLIPGSYVQITYYAYNSRDDIITLASNGTFHDIKGQPALASEVRPPRLSSNEANYTLELGYIQVEPGEQGGTPVMATTPRIPFTGIDDMALAIQGLKEDMNVLSARQATMSGIDPTTLLDTFSDYFLNDSKADIGDSPYFDVAYTPYGEITPGFLAEGWATLTDQPTTDYASSNDYTGSSDILEDANNEDTYMMQNVMTTSMPLNNFGNISLQGNIALDPDEFHDTDSVDVIWTPDDIKTIDSRNLTSMATTSGGNAELKSLNVTSKGDTFTASDAVDLGGTMDKSTSTSMEDYQARKYMASQWIHVGGNGFTPNAPDFALYVASDDNLQLNLIPNDPSGGNQNANGKFDNSSAFGYPDGVQGNKTNTINADSNGNVSGWFLIPSRRIPCGIQQIVLRNPDGEYGTATLNGTLNKPVQYNTLHYTYINNSERLLAASADATQSAESLSTEISSVSAAASEARASLSDSTEQAVNDLNTNLETDDDNLNSAISAQGSVSQSLADSLSDEEVDESNVVSSLNDYTDFMFSVNDNMMNSMQLSMDDMTSIMNSATASLSGAVSDEATVEKLDSATLSNYIDSLSMASMMTTNSLDNDVASMNSSMDTMTSSIASCTSNENSLTNELYDVEDSVDINTLNITNNRVGIMANSADIMHNSASISAVRSTVTSDADSLAIGVAEARSNATSLSDAVDALQYSDRQLQAKERNNAIHISDLRRSTNHKYHTALNQITDVHIDDKTSPRDLVWFEGKRMHEVGRISMPLLRAVHARTTTEEYTIFHSDSPIHWNTKDSEYQNAANNGIVLNRHLIVPPYSSYKVWGGMHLFGKDNSVKLATEKLKNAGYYEPEFRKK